MDDRRSDLPGGLSPGVLELYVLPDPVNEVWDPEPATVRQNVDEVGDRGSATVELLRNVSRSASRNSGNDFTCQNAAINPRRALLGGRGPLRRCRLAIGAYGTRVRPHFRHGHDSASPECGSGVH